MGTGYKLRTDINPGSPKTMLTDEQVLECRRRHEYEGCKMRTLAAEFDTSWEYMRAILDYRNRSKLIPRRPK
jgi:hypothetical protein